MMPWAEEISQLTMNIISKQLLQIFIIAKYLPPPQSKNSFITICWCGKLLSLTVAADTCICSSLLVGQKSIAQN